MLLMGVFYVYLLRARHLKRVRRRRRRARRASAGSGGMYFCLLFFFIYIFFLSVYGTVYWKCRFID